MPGPEKTQDDYFQEWYDEHGETLNAKRRERYANDPAYRERVQRWNRQLRQRKRREAEAERKRERRAMKMRPSSGAWKTVDVDVDGVTVRMFTIGALARAVGKGISTIRVWERNGTLPETPYRSDKGDRLYTLEMVEAIRDELRKAGRLERGKVHPKKRPPYVVREVRFRNGKVRKLRLYKVGTLARAVNRTVVALAQMEKREVLPRTPLVASSLEYRLYTIGMIEAVERAFNRRGGTIRGEIEWRDFYDEIVEEWTRLGVMDAEVVDA